MNTIAALLAAIKAHPAEDAPRLMYADLLDEEAGRATKRAELIRVQCKMTSTPQVLTPGVPLYEDIRTDAFGPAPVERVLRGYKVPPVANPTYETLRARETALLKKWGMAWVPKVGRKEEKYSPTAGVLINVTRYIQDCPFTISGRTITTGHRTMTAYTFARGFVADALVVWPEPPRGAMSFPYTAYLMPLPAAQPVEHVAFRADGFEPKLYVTISRDKRAGWWFARLDWGTLDGAVSDAYETRRELVGAGLGAFLARNLGHIRFNYVEPAIPF